MLTLDQINEIVADMVANDIAGLEVEGRGYALRLTRRPGTQGRVRARQDALCPASGRFVPRGGEDGLPTLERGAEIAAGEPLGYIAQGPVRLLCVAPVAGRLAGPLPSEGTEVEAGAALVTLEARS